MNTITLKNDITFVCHENETIIEGAKRANLVLEHSCLTGRCSSCKVLVNSGESITKTDELGLDQTEKEAGYILSCIRIPQSDMHIEAEDLSEYSVSEPKTLPAKISSIEKLADDVIKVELRVPPNQKFDFIPGQYITIIKGEIRRSYSIANSNLDTSTLTFFIKNYPGGVFSNYWFNTALPNDLLRIEGPKGTFFIRKQFKETKNLIFLATGTGIAPVKAILESLEKNSDKFEEINLYVFWGARYAKDLFWNPEYLKLKVNYFPVLSQEETEITAKGYVQNILLSKEIDLGKSVVYACGSNEMIKEASAKLIENGLHSNNFYSDAFVISN